MAFLNRLRQSQLHKILLQKCCSNQSSLHSRINNNLNNNLPNNVRFFAAPAQYVKKEKVEHTGPLLNEQITHPVIRLVTEEGHKIVSRREALEVARHHDLDLVEVDPNAKPPVCKLMDYNKTRYDQQIKEKEITKKLKTNRKKNILKEVRFAARIGPRDLQMKADNARRLLEEGYRIRCQVNRKKPEDDLEGCLSSLLALIQDVALVEFGPIVEEKNAAFVLRHVKLGATKTKKAKVARPSSESDESQPEIESENVSESDEDDQVTDDEDGASASANVRQNKEELTPPPVNRYAKPTSPPTIKEELTPPPANRYAKPTSPPTMKEELTPPANRYAKPTSRGPSIDSAGSPAAPIGTDNRYKREPRNYNAPVSNNGPRMQPPPTERGRQPQFNSTSPHNREGHRPGFSNPNYPRQNSPSTPEQQNPPGQTNRYKKASSGDSRVDNRNSGAPNSRYNRGGGE